MKSLANRKCRSLASTPKRDTAAAGGCCCRQALQADGFRTLRKRHASASVGWLERACSHRRGVPRQVAQCPGQLVLRRTFGQDRRAAGAARQVARREAQRARRMVATRAWQCFQAQVQIHQKGKRSGRSTRRWCRSRRRSRFVWPHTRGRRAPASVGWPERACSRMRAQTPVLGCRCYLHVLD